MRIKIKADMSGTRDGVPWPSRGEEIDVPDDEGAQLCAAGIAAPVKAAAEVETATVDEGDVESRATRASRSSSKAKG